MMTAASLIQPAFLSCNVIEERYGRSVEDEELVPENLDSVKNLVAFLGRKGIH